MRFPIFPRGSNPSIDPWILKKKMPHLEKEVADGISDWVDPNNHAAGIICRPIVRVQDATFLHSALGDWFISERSVLPREMWDTHGPVLNITTRQLATA